MANSVREDVRNIVLDLVASQDLGTLTAKKIRSEVRDKLGDRAGDEPSLRVLVRELIDEAIASVEKTKSASRRDNVTKENASYVERYGSGNTNAENPGAVSTNTRTVRGSLPEDSHQNRVLHGNSNRSTRFSKRKRPTNKKLEEFSDDDSSSSDTRHCNYESRKKIKPGEKLHGDSPDDDDQESSDGEQRQCRVRSNQNKSGAKSLFKAKKTQTNRKMSPVCESKSAQKSDEQIDPRVRKLLGIARELGIPVPPSRLRCPVGKKFDACVEYLRLKGVGNPDLLNMRKHDIAKLRTKLENERELDGLDSSNIIRSDAPCSRRTTRAAAPKAYATGRNKDAHDDDDSDHSDESSSSESEFRGSESDDDKKRSAFDSENELAEDLSS